MDLVGMNMIMREYHIEIELIDCVSELIHFYPDSEFEFNLGLNVTWFRL